MWDGRLGRMMWKAIGSSAFRTWPNLPTRTSLVQGWRSWKELEIKNMRSQTLIENVQTGLVVPIFFDLQKPENLCFYIDCRELNAFTRKDIYSMCKMDDWISFIKEITDLSTLDADGGWYQVEIEKRNLHETASTLLYKTNSFIALPFGLKRDSCAFYRSRNLVIASVKWKLPLEYLDDIIIYFMSAEEHISYVPRVLTFLNSADIASISKMYEFLTEKI